MHDTIIGLFFIAAGALILWYRDDFTDQLLEHYRRTWGIDDYDRTRMRSMHVVIGIGFCVLGLLALFG